MRRCSFDDEIDYVNSYGFMLPRFGLRYNKEDCKFCYFSFPVKIGRFLRADVGKFI